MVARSRVNPTLLHLWQPKLKESAVVKGINCGIFEQFLALSYIIETGVWSMENTMTSIFSIAIKGC